MFNLKSISFERMKKPPSGREKEVRNMSAEEFFQIDGTNARFMREGKL